MMKLCPTVLGLIAIFTSYGEAIPTWPSSIDELEDVMFLNSGYKSRGFGAHVTPCSHSEFGVGRQTAAEWLRIGFHDMSTANVYNAPHGGIDASMAFELNDGENIGAGFTSSLTTYGGLYNTQLSVADLIALGVYASVRACGGPVIPMRGGRVDATAAGPIGVPQPQNGQGTFINQFSRMGFNVTEMIQMTACGHTLGGVHAGDFSNIVAPGTAPNDFQLFDSTTDFDNLIATRYINGPDTDPLAVGISTSSGRNSDFAVFTADKNVTLQAMTNAETFNSMCTTILQKMIEGVDPAIVTLSDVIQPYEVKPAGLQLALLSGGASITFSGDIRVRTTVRAASQISSVQIVYKDRTGAAGGTITTSTVSGTAAGFDDSFSFYGFSKDISSTTSISSFTVIIISTSGATTTYDNNGSGFPISDSVIVQTPQSCLANGKLTIMAAVRSTITTTPTLSITQKVARTSPSAIPVPSLANTTVTMTIGSTIGPYILYSGSTTISSTTGTKYGVSSGLFSDSFKDVSALGATCSTLGTVASSSSSTSSSTSTSKTSTSSTVSTSKTSTSTSSSATISQTPAHKQTIGSYTFQGCYTEGNGVRALSAASFYDYKAMTSEMCAANCAGYTYWGVEYGGECYCGNTLAPSSTLATISNCSFLCPGNSLEYCGAGNRLEMYKLTSSSSTTSPTSSSTTKSTTSSTSTTSTTSTKSSSTLSTSTTSTSTSTSTTKASSTPSSTPTLHIVPSSGLYNYYGCYTEATSVRALAAASYPSDTQTVESCISACSPYLYAGLEYGRECRCGNNFGAGSTLVANSDCNMVCAGDKTEYCGAGNRLNVYIRNGTGTGTSTSGAGSTSSPPLTPTSTLTSSSSSTTSTSTTSSPTPKIKPKIGSYTYYACITEATSVRALSSLSTYNYTSMTLELCASTCTSYKYFGVEYGGECYCGNAFGAGSVNATKGDAECDFTCPGDGSEWCGAGNRLSTYVLSS